MTTWWCELAVIDGAVEPGVTITATNGRISSVSPRTQPTPDDVQLDGLTVAGFANAHSHAFHRALRSRVQADRGSFWTWREIMYRAAERLDPDSYHSLARAVFAEMAQAGTAVVGEFHYVHHQPNGEHYADPNAMGNALLAAADDAGIRITLLDTIYLHGGLDVDGYLPAAGAQLRYRDDSAGAWAERVERLADSETHRIAAAIHSVRAVDPDAIAFAAAWAEANDAPLHAHVSEQPAENAQCQAHHRCSPVELLDQHGALGERFTAVHATHLSPTDIDRLASTSSGVCMCPTTERDLGDGIGPTTELAAAHVGLSLGSDSHAVIDQMVEARAVELHERLRSQQRGLHSADELLTMATLHGHRSLGWSDAGTITVGNRADLTTISLRSTRTAGSSPAHAVEAAVFASTSSDITSVVIDGATVVNGGEHTSIDVERELAVAIEELLR